MIDAINTIEIKVNGEPHTCTAATALPQLLIKLGLNPRLIAVEYNGEILHRQYWDTTQMQSGDRLEIVTIVGGGW
ncbi:MAG: sulfur carrier protein ThiS [Cyanobacteria bacterium J06621_8]